MPRANQVCSKVGCLKPPTVKGRCGEHPFPTFVPPWSRKENAPYGVRLPKGVRDAVKRRDSHTCQMCGLETPLVEVDHRTPRFLGGDDSPNNLWALCPKCHIRKTNSEAAVARRLAQQERRD